jgi:hypothetical protein
MSLLLTGVRPESGHSLTPLGASIEVKFAASTNGSEMILVEKFWFMMRGQPVPNGTEGSSTRLGGEDVVACVFEDIRRAIDGAET